MQKKLILDLNQRAIEFLKNQTETNNIKYEVLKNDLISKRYNVNDKITINNTIFNLINIEDVKKTKYDDYIIFPYYSFESFNNQHIEYAINKVPKTILINSDDIITEISMKKINKTVVFVGSLFNDIRQISTELGIYNYFKNMNISTILVTSNGEYADDKRIFTLADLYAQNCEIKKKIFMINKRIYELEKKCNPQVIIIGLKGEITDIDEYLVGDFGINYFTLFKSVHPDFVILNVFCNYYEKNEMANIFKNINQRAFCSIDLFSLTDFYYEQPNPLGNMNSTLCILDRNTQENILNKYRNENFDSICLCDDFEYMFKKIKEKLWREQ